MLSLRLYRDIRGNWRELLTDRMYMVDGSDDNKLVIDFEYETKQCRVIYDEKAFNKH